MAQIGEVSVAVKPDFSGFRRAVNTFLESIRDAEIRIAPDMDNFRQKVNAYTSNMDDVEVQVNADVAAAAERINEVARDRRATITVDVDQSQLSQIGKLFGGGGSGGGLFSGLGGFGLAAGGMRTFAIAAGILAGLGPALAVVSTTLAALPGVIAGVGIPLGLLALNAEGLKKSFANLAPDIEKLKQSFMIGFDISLIASGAKDQFRLLLDQIGPEVSKIGASLAGAFSAFTEGLVSGGALNSLQSLMGNIGDRIHEMQPGITKFVEGFLRLANTVTGKGMSEAFNQLADGFLRFTSNPENIKMIEEALSGLLTVLRQMGGDILKLVVDGIKQMSDPKFVENLKEMAAGLGTVVRLVAGFGNFMSSLEGFGKLFSSPIGTFFSSLGDGLGVVDSAKQAFSSLMGIVQALFPTFTQLGSVVVGAWQSIVSACVNGVAQAITVIAGFGSQAVAAVTGYVGAMVDAGTQLIMGLVTGLGNAVGAAVAKAREVASQVAGAVKGFFGISSPSKLMAEYGGYVVEGLANGIQDQKANAVASMTDVMKELGSVIDDGIKEQIQAMQDAGTEFGKGLTGMPFDFIDSVSKQAMSDIGISGGGLMGSVMDTGMNWARDAVTNIWNVNNMDDAIQGEWAQQRKAVAGVAGR